MKLAEEEATEFFAEFYRGEHHFPSKLKPYGFGWSMNHLGPLATFDNDELTRLVILAHDRCIRVQLEQGGPDRIKISIWKRSREGRMYEIHPTIEEVLNKTSRKSLVTSNGHLVI